MIDIPSDAEIGMAALAQRSRAERLTASPSRMSTGCAPSAYAALLDDQVPAVRDNAARAWCARKDAHVSLSPGHVASLAHRDPEFRLRFARLVTHYWRHAAFLEEDQLIRDAAKPNGIPGVLIHGRCDVGSPLETAWRLSKRWTTCELHILDDAGHGGGKTFMPLVIGTLNDFATL